MPRRPAVPHRSPADPVRGNRRKIHGVLRSALSDAVRFDLVARNVAKWSRSRPAPLTERRAPIVAEVRTFLARRCGRPPRGGLRPGRVHGLAPRRTARAPVVGPRRRARGPARPPHRAALRRRVDLRTVMEVIGHSTLSTHHGHLRPRAPEPDVRRGGRHGPRLAGQLMRPWLHDGCVGAKVSFPSNRGHIHYEEWLCPRRDASSIRSSARARYGS